MAVPSGDDLIEEVGGLLIQRKIAQFVNYEEGGLSVELKFANQGMIDLGRQQVIQHVHGGGEQHALVGLTGTPADDFGQVGFAHSGIADDAHARALAHEVEIEQTQDAGFQLGARLVMVKVEAVDGRFRLQTRELEATFDRTLVAILELAIHQCF